MREEAFVIKTEDGEKKNNILRGFVIYITILYMFCMCIDITKGIIADRDAGIVAILSDISAILNGDAYEEDEYYNELHNTERGITNVKEETEE